LFAKIIRFFVCILKKLLAIKISGI